MMKKASKPPGRNAPPSNAKGRAAPLDGARNAKVLPVTPYRPPPRRPAAAAAAAAKQTSASPPSPVAAGIAKYKTPFILGGIAVYGLALYGTYAYYSLLKNLPDDSAVAAGAAAHASGPAVVKEDRSEVYDKIAKKYDSEIWASEFFMGMPLLRRALAKRAKGDVLEVSAGTGRNSKYYLLKQCRSITMVDTSRPMLEQARKAFMKQHRGYRDLHFLVQDASEPLASPSGGKFDTVIQSMGLCSHHSPVQLLRNLGGACKPDGKIILLEHGKSYYDSLNRTLDSLAPKHAETWGCWWNRDITKILEDSGLRVEKVSRYHFGTTYWIEARPPKQSDGEKTQGLVGKDAGA